MNSNYVLFSLTGLCVCINNFFGCDCSIDLSIAPIVTPNVNILCDGGCDNAIVFGNGFANVGTLTCQFTSISVSLLCFLSTLVILCHQTPHECDGLVVNISYVC